MDIISRYYEFVKWVIEKNKDEIIITSVSLAFILFVSMIAIYFDPDVFSLYLIIAGVNLIFFGFGIFSYNIKADWLKFNEECPPEDIRIMNRLRGE